MARTSRRWPSRLLFVFALVMGLFIARACFERRQTADRTRASGTLSLVGEALPALDGAAGWIGRRPDADSLSRRVAAVVFWSSTQPGSLRALEEVRAWHEAYGRFGLEVVGVHVPEFAFAAESAHVAAAVRRLGIGFPVALDPSLAVWNAFGGGGARPRVVVTDAAGHVVADRHGPKALKGTGTEIRARLEAARPGLRFPTGGDRPDPSVAGHGMVHLGRARVASGPLVEAAAGRPVTFTAQIRHQVEGAPYVPYPVGRWILGGDGLTAARAGASNFVALRYDAGPLGAVLGPPGSGPARVWVLRDEHWLKPEEMGEDVRLDGRGASYVLVEEPRLYALCREASRQHVVKLSPEEPGVTLYAFTFEAWTRPRPGGL